jgi:hypothetical protein
MERSLKLFRDAGWTCDKTEHYNYFGNVRVDLFNFCDILAMRPGGGFVAIQTGGRGEVRGHIQKILAEPRALTFLQSPGRIIVHGWAKMGAFGTKKKWVCKGIEITERHFKKCQNRTRPPKQPMFSMLKQIEISLALNSFKS